MNTKTKLIKKYHTLCGNLGMTDEDRREMLWNNYQVTSSKDLYLEQLQGLCKNLSSGKPNKSIELDKARKRVIAVLFSYLRYNGYSPDMEYVKATACRAAQEPVFNKILPSKLSQLYRIFGDMRSTEGLKWASAELNKITN